MRPIKFRAKGCTGDELWFYIEVPNIFDGGSIWYKGFDWNTLGQYTGLKDKHGVEIYEGDIIKVLTEPSFLSVVEFKDAAFFPVSSKKVRDGADFEVIGNIWENGDLLK